MTLIRSIFLCALLLVYSASAALAWGAKGHEAIAELAWRNLTPAARAAVVRLIGDHEAFLRASLWADEVRRQRPGTASWHFVDIPFAQGVYLAARDSRRDDCVVARIISFEQIMADNGVVDPLRAEALKWIIHFVGDVHQPLHAIDDNDRGGNDVWVGFQGKTERLHALWDAGLLDRTRAGPLELAEWAGAARADEGGMVEDWANESAEIARTFIYPRSRGKNSKDTPIILDPGYEAEALPLFQRRLGQAGVRLAHILNASFTSETARVP